MLETRNSFPSSTNSWRAPVPTDTVDKSATPTYKCPEDSGNPSEAPASISPSLRWLFETPADLVCPITHELYKDPVINCVGQVYDREAITTHLRQSRTDPMTQLPLADTTLTPVFVLRSRAKEYCSSAAESCIHEACKLECRSPAEMLRRAVELLGTCSGLQQQEAPQDSSLSALGLSPECMRFVHDNPTSKDDIAALKHLAEGLQQAGLSDRASNVHLHCLVAQEAAGDWDAQVSSFKKYLCSCDMQSGNVSISTPNLEQLAYLVEVRKVMTWSHMLDLSQAVHSSPTQQDGCCLFTRSLCEELMKRTMKQQPGPQQDWAGFQEIHLRYNQLRFQELASSNQLLARQIAAQDRAAELCPASDDSQPMQEAVAPRRCPVAGKLLRWLRGRPGKRWVATGLCALAMLLEPRGAMGRASRALPVLLLAHA